MRSASESASTLLTGWQLNGSIVDVVVRTKEINVDAAGSVKYLPDSHLDLALSDGSSVVRFFLAGLSIAAHEPSESLPPPLESSVVPDSAFVVVSRKGSDPICALFARGEREPIKSDT